MAHVFARNRALVDQENGAEQKRSLGGKFKRSPNDVAQAVISSATKRPALTSITNQALSRERQAPVKPPPYVSKPKPNQLQTTLDELFFPPAPPLPVTSSFFYTEAPGVQLPPTSCTIGLSSCSNGNTSRGSSAGNSFSLSASFHSLATPGSFDSPMLLSTPDAQHGRLLCSEMIDIDLHDNTNCTACGEYAKDIFAYLREAEVRFHPKPGYMSKQPDITNGMRSILVDWLVEVSDEFKLEAQTLHLAVTITDRFLSVMSVMRSKLQLVGTASMFIAAKFEEIYPPEIADFVYITDDTYHKGQIARMEMLILQTLDFNLGAPTTYLFVQRYLKAAETEHLPASSLSSSPHTPSLLHQTITALSRYFCELAMQDADPYLKYFPSVIAASAVCLAQHTLGQPAWPAVLQHYSGYTVSDIGNCLQDLHRTFSLAHRHSQQAVRQKYSSERYMKVATLKPPETLPC